MAIKLACVHCGNVKIKLLEEQYNDFNNYITRYFKCPNCEKTFETFELNLEDELNEFRCLLCGELSLSTFKSDKKYCTKCIKTIEGIKQAIRSNSDKINKKLEEDKLNKINRKIFENTKKYRGNFFPVNEFHKMTHYIYSFMKPTHPKKPVKDAVLSKELLRKYFDEGAIIGFVQLKEGDFEKSKVQLKEGNFEKSKESDSKKPKVKVNIIKKIREERNYNKTKFSKLLEISHVTLTKYENNENLENVPLKVITKLSKLYDIPIDYIASNLEDIAKM